MYNVSKIALSNLLILCTILLINCSQVDEVTQKASETIFENSEQEVLFGLKDISLSSNETYVSAGEKISLEVLGIYKDGSTKSISTAVTWTINDPTLATITGIKDFELALLALSEGALEITASIGEYSKTIAITVGEAVVRGIYFMPKLITVPNNAISEFSIFATLSNNGIVDISADEGLELTVPEGLEQIGVNDAGKIEFRSLAKGQMIVNASYKTVTGSGIIDVKTDEISSYSISPMDSTVSLGEVTKFTATGVSEDGYNFNISDKVAWSLGDPAKGSISSSGSFTPTQLGENTITSVYEEQSITAKIFVRTSNIQTIELATDVERLPNGLTGIWTATAVHEDGSKYDITSSCVFSSSDTSKAEFQTKTVDGNTVKTNSLLAKESEQFIRIFADCFGIQGSKDYWTSGATVVDFKVTNTNGTTLNEIEINNAGLNLDVYVWAIRSDGQENQVASKPVSVGISGLTYEIGESNLLTISSSRTGKGFIRLSSDTVTKEIPIKVDSARLDVLYIVSKEDDFEENNIPLGNKKSYQVYARYSNDDDDEEMTDLYSPPAGDVFWFVEYDTTEFSTPPIYISNQEDSEGEVTNFMETHASAADKQPKVWAKFGGKTASVALTVNPPVIDSIELSASSQEVVKADTPTITGQATLSDTTTKSLHEICSTYDLVLEQKASTLNTDTYYTDNPLFSVDETNICVNGQIVLTADYEGQANFTMTVTPKDGNNQYRETDGSVVSDDDLNLVIRTPNCTADGTNIVQFGSHGNHNNIYCWYKSAKDQSCTDVCSANGDGNTSVHLPALQYLAGDQGNATSCENLLKEFSSFSAITTTSLSDENNDVNLQNLGCSVYDPGGGFPNKLMRYTFASTTAEAKDTNHFRVCSCTN